MGGEAEGGGAWVAVGMGGPPCVFHRGRCWLTSGLCAYCGQLLNLHGAYQTLWAFGSQAELLAPSPLPHPHPRLPLGAGTEVWQALIPRKRMGPRDTWRRKASGRRGGPFPSSAGRTGGEEGASTGPRAQDALWETSCSAQAGVTPRRPSPGRRPPQGQGCSGVLASAGQARTESGRGR